MACVDLTCRFGPFTALDGVDLAVRRGAICALLGPNGAGKTTLLSVLATLLRPSGGRACVAGWDVVGQAQAVRAAVGLVAHQTLLYAFLTADENLAFHAQLHGRRQSDSARRALLDRFGVGRSQHQPIGRLSRGTAQRIGLARAALHEPAVLLLDEPHSGLDARSADALDQYLIQAAGNGVTVLVALHDLGRAKALAGQFVLLHHARVAWQADMGAVDEQTLRSEYARLTDDTIPPPRARAVSVLHAHAEPGRSNPQPVSAWATISAIVRKDLLAELRAREIVLPMAIFSVLVIAVFFYALPLQDLLVVNPEWRPVLLPGIAWVALLMASTLGLARGMAGELQAGGWTGLLVSPSDRGALFIGKWLAGYLFNLAVLAVFLPVMAVVLAAPVLRLAMFAAIVALGLVGWTAAGTLLNAMITRTRAREVLLPVLLYPLVLPLLLPAVRASSSVLSDSLPVFGLPATGLGAGTPVATGALGAALVLVVAYDVVFWLVGFLFFPYVLEG